MFHKFLESAMRTKMAKEGERLYDLGKEHLLNGELDLALEFYEKSYQAKAHPAPLIDSAQIKIARLRHFEAQADLLRAQQLDSAMGGGFAAAIVPSLEHLALTTDLYRNGKRQEFISDLREMGNGYVAKRILSACFGIDPDSWEELRRPTPLMHFHLFNDFDSISKHESRDSYPFVWPLIDRYPRAYIEHEMLRCPDPTAYRLVDLKMCTFLCAFDIDDMQLVRSEILLEIHDAAMEASYGFMGKYQSETHGIVPQAHVYLDDDR